MRPLALLLLSACSSAQPGGPVADAGSEEAGPSPVEQCETLLDRICTRDVACKNSPDMPSCLAAARGAIKCAQAVAVEPGYQQCLDDVEVVTCESLAKAFPATCKDVIVVR
jgi:hypothetical protein